MTAPLISLEQHNKEAAERLAARSRQPTGIACPTCGKELYMTDVVLCSDPPRAVVECVCCGYKGDILVG